MQNHQEYKISGVSVYFPCKPYPSQFSMMDKIIKGIDRRQHCLLESPTGSGKSLALLCSALAWQTAEKGKQDEEEEKAALKALCTCECHQAANLDTGQAKQSSPHDSNAKQQEKEAKQEYKNAKSEENGISKGHSSCLLVEVYSDDDDDFKVPNRQQSRNKHITIAYEDFNTSAVGLNQENDVKADNKCNVTQQEKCNLCACDDSEKQQIKIPKIYFGTRTHKQVAQIARELRKTAYHDTKMTILGSREHTCIHPEVSRLKNKNDGCKDLLNGPGCHFKDHTQRLTSQKAVKDLGLSTAWDLEDLVSVCKTKRACPYFLSRGLKEESDLVICPYNYLVDPIVRDAMMIKLKGHVVILDEAHNIEDSAREAASQSIPQDSLHKAIKDLEGLMEENISLADHSKLRSMLKSLDSLIEENQGSLEQKDFDKSYKVWSGFHIVAELEALGLGPKHISDFVSAMSNIKKESEERKEKALNAGLNPASVEMKPATGSVLEQVFQIMDYLYRADLKYVDDYRASIVQFTSYQPSTNQAVWLNARGRNGGRNMVAVDVFTLNFWCMNPGVAFSDFVETRSVILTSGTLSPMNSFQSELGLDFKIMLEAGHVIKDSQVWVGALGQGPSGTGLQAVYRNLETFAFQDELGRLVLRVCQTVPHGVLCFLPSYKVLEKLCSRWEATGTLAQISRKKKVICEPRGSDKVDFESQMKLFYNIINHGQDDEEGEELDGAIFFAVCRGKVSEGLDFADNFARAVISVGIPYPNFKDVQVDLKRKYNDMHRQSRGLLSGHDWYEIQAFRALNQALGRCIRHRSDWGALIIVDDRFVKNAPKYCKGLSKWVRNKVKFFPDFSCAMHSLGQFTSACQENDAQQDAEHSASLSHDPQSPRKPLHSVNSEERYAAPLPATMVETKPKQNFPIFSFASSLLTPSPKGSHRQPSGTPSSKLAQRMGVTGKSSPLTSGHQRADETTGPPQMAPWKPRALTPVFLVPTSTGGAVRTVVHSTRADYQAGTADTITTRAEERTVRQTSSVPGIMRQAQNGASTSSEERPSHKNDPRPSSLQSYPQTDNPDNKVQLRIVTQRAPVGTRFQVFEIPQHLHRVFGGNLNLPVSTAERLVYLVDPPPGPGKNPTARLITMSEEWKDYKLSELGSDKPYIGFVDHKLSQQVLKLYIASVTASDDTPRAKNHQPTEEPLLSGRSQRKAVAMTDQSPELYSQPEEETTPSSSTPQSSTKPDSSSVLGKHTAPSKQTEHSAETPDLKSKRKQKTPPDEDIESSELKSRHVTASPQDEAANISTTSPKPNSCSPPIGPYSVAKPKPLFKPVRQAPPLLHSPSVLTTPDTKLGHKPDQSSTTPQAVPQTAANVRVASRRSIEEIVVSDSDFEEDMTPVKRKVRDRKRKSWSLGKKEASAKKSKTESTKAASAQNVQPPATNPAVRLKCKTCGHPLLTYVHSTDFHQERRTPAFLRKHFSRPMNKDEGCLFFSTNPGRDGLISPIAIYAQANPGHYVEQEDIVVQFMYCQHCHYLTLTKNGPNWLNAVGAQIEWASSVRFSKGQIWLFSDQIRQDTIPDINWDLSLLPVGFD